jgi:hypothetical protein
MCGRHAWRLDNHNSGLNYDAASNTYTYVWKSDKSMGGTCQLFTLLLIDGSDHIAYFQFK